ncbi:uncharacterized protein Z519_07022 [Cladophialophora bantiana CBS 173.52]|uniref:FAD-binding domain-containing protein n=1 Tax=Cladophialophora bantiana (strain ATCC 10958 / CBS 173.52 / CDC B-1940 / NIH 8579) TaxID=1442370 RepID=A0A0D2HMQ5_CLAB1|nr:uncharacterized protein Z519_07022 [Cladophialophora bantiana CBS 173.52]KIW92040.1 hypothetical protein Z519_07022 [Cladophialophora bantiana CBS 173.52]
MTSQFHVAIIGAGLVGLKMALALHVHSIKCTVYEQAASTGGRFAGAVMLSPDSLRILDKYGAYAQLREQVYNFPAVKIRDAEGEPEDSCFYLGSRELFGYDALRAYRNVILKVLSTACAERRIDVVSGKKFSEILLSEDDDGQEDDGVHFKFQDGTMAHADILVAADGIHIKIRTVLFPQFRPEYNGVLVVCGAVKASSLNGAGGGGADGNDGLDTVAILEGRNGAGAFLLGPQLSDASELLAGTQRPFLPQTREEWARLSADQDFHLDFLREGYENRVPIVQRAVDNIVLGSTYIWPLQTLPKLERWWSSSSKNLDGSNGEGGGTANDSGGGGRVILMGDAAHAMPPTSSQGANQAFEDGWMLARVLKAVFTFDNVGSHAGSDARGSKVVKSSIEVDERLRKSLQTWHARRQDRIDRILQLTQQMHNLRLPIEEQRKLNDGEIYRSLARFQQARAGHRHEHEHDGVEHDEEAYFKMAVLEQWAWLYCPDDLVEDFQGKTDSDDNADGGL